MVTRTLPCAVTWKPTRLADGGCRQAPPAPTANGARPAGQPIHKRFRRPGVIGRAFPRQLHGVGDGYLAQQGG